MATGISTGATTLFAASFRPPSAGGRVLHFSPLSLGRAGELWPLVRRWRTATVFLVLGDERPTSPADDMMTTTTPSRAAEWMAQKQSERQTYLIAAVMSSFGITSMAVAAVYYRFAWQMEGGEVPMTEMAGTFALSVGAAVGMEFWARWAHRALWHASLWHMHESHHRPRDGPFKLNDVFAVINAVPAISLLSFGFFNRGLLPGLCFGAGLGIRLFGLAYVFVHDGLVHRRFPVGPSPTCHTFGVLLLPTRFITRTSSMGCRMGCSWAPRNWRRLVGWRSWRRRLAGGRRRHITAPTIKLID